MIHESEAARKIEAILVKPGRSWSPEERQIVLDWLLRRDPFDLGLCASNFFRNRWPGIAKEDALEIFNSFLERRLDRLLGFYNPEQGKLKTYLRFCLQRHCQARAFRLWKRDQKHRESPFFSPDMESELLRARDVSIEGNPARRLEQWELGRELQIALDSLPAQYRQALTLYAEGKSYEEIARELDVTLAVVKNRLHRARQRLRREFPELRPKSGI
ncbi:MAG TPA: sigma-70 family RNA polymerase sigma factor [Thermoanaerobaculia bacterium]|jgi:RNA polymerase sigma factor (sigma-70 family)|nr:sigma-70 family RNA polymerase sigma factor [Thermoanaerobaculia bacterium]